MHKVEVLYELVVCLLVSSGLDDVCIDDTNPATS